MCVIWNIKNIFLDDYYKSEIWDTKEIFSIISIMKWNKIVKAHTFLKFLILYIMTQVN